MADDAGYGVEMLSPLTHVFLYGNVLRGEFSEFCQGPTCKAFPGHMACRHVSPNTQAAFAAPNTEAVMHTEVHFPVFSTDG